MSIKVGDVVTFTKESLIDDLRCCYIESCSNCSKNLSEVKFIVTRTKLKSSHEECAYLKCLSTEKLYGSEELKTGLCTNVINLTIAEKTSEDSWTSHLLKEKEIFEKTSKKTEHQIAKTFILSLKK